MGGVSSSSLLDERRRLRVVGSGDGAELFDGVIEPVPVDQEVEDLSETAGRSIRTRAAGAGANRVQRARRVRGHGGGGEVRWSQGFQPGREQRCGEVLGVQGDDRAGAGDNSGRDDVFIVRVGQAVGAARLPSR